MKRLLLVLAACTVAGVGCGGGPGRVTGRPTLLQPPKEKSVERLKPVAMRVIREGLKSEDPFVRMHAIEVIARTNATELMGEVTERFEDETGSVRFAAAVAVGDLRYRPARRELERLVEEEEVNVKIAACYGLCRLGRSEYYRTIVEKTESSDQTVRANAAMLLGKLGDRRALPALKEALYASDSDDKVMYSAAESIAMLGGEEIYPRLWTLLISKFLDDRLVGVRAMAELSTPEARNALMTMLEDEAGEVRLLAAERLAANGENAGLQQILDFFNGRMNFNDDKQRKVIASVFATQAIGRLGTAKLTSYLPGLLGSDFQAVRLAAAQSVLRLAGQE